MSAKTTGFSNWMNGVIEARSCGVGHLRITVGLAELASDEVKRSNDPESHIMCVHICD